MWDFENHSFPETGSIVRLSTIVAVSSLFLFSGNIVRADGPPPPCADPCSTGCPIANSPCCDMPIPSDCCEVTAANDCNDNKVKDSCDLTYRINIDCNENGIPDVCDFTEGTSVDKVYEQFHYDALGRRIAKISDQCDGTPEFIRYYYSGGNVILETDVTNTPKRSFINGAQYIDERILMRDESMGIDFYYLDRENHSVAGMAVHTGFVVESYDYYAYGSVKIYDGYENEVDPVEGSLWGNPYFFTGRRLDVVADRGLNYSSRLSNLPLSWPRQLYHYRSRTMDPIHGRFMQRDPAGYVDGMNLYEYTRSNPGRFVDPYGLWGEDVHYDLTKELAEKAGFACPEFVALGANRPDADGRQMDKTYHEDDYYELERDAPSSFAYWYKTTDRQAAADRWRQAVLWHFPMDEDGIVRPNSFAARRFALDGLRRCHLNDFAEGLHTLGDSWAHQGRPYMDGLGHFRAVREVYTGPIDANYRERFPNANIEIEDISGGLLAALSHSADKVKYWPEDARATGNAVYRLMLRFLKECPCACPGSGNRFFRTAAKKPENVDVVGTFLLKKFSGKNVVPTTYLDAE